MLHSLLFSKNHDSSDACMSCDLFDFQGIVNAYPMNNLMFLYGINYDKHHCYEGCHYEVNYMNYPDFILLQNQDGKSENILNSPNCGENITCYDSLDNRREMMRRVQVFLITSHEVMIHMITWTRR